MSNFWWLEKNAANISDATLRDYFAAKALQGVLSSPTDPRTFESLAEFCYKAADAMIKARGEK